MKIKTATMFALLSSLGIAHADCVSAPCAAPTITILATATAKIKCPQYVTLDGIRLPFDQVRNVSNAIAGIGTASCIYDNKDSSLYVNIDADIEKEQP